MHASMDMLDDAREKRVIKQDACLQITLMAGRCPQFLEEKTEDKNEDKVTTIASDPEFGMGFALAPFAVSESY